MSTFNDYVDQQGRNWKVSIEHIVAVFENQAGFTCVLLSTGMVIATSDVYSSLSGSWATARNAASPALP